MGRSRCFGPVGGLPRNELPSRLAPRMERVSAKFDKRVFRSVLSEVRFPSFVPTIVAAYLLVFPMDLGYLYSIASRACWSQNFHFEPLILQRQKFHGGVKTLKCLVCDCPVTLDATEKFGPGGCSIKLPFYFACVRHLFWSIRAGWRYTIVRTNIFVTRRWR